MILATRRDYERAKELIRTNLSYGVQPKSSFLKFQRMGISRFATELAIAALMREGVVEQLLVIPRDGEGSKAGAKPTMLALTSAVDSGMTPVPEGMLRVKDAMLMVSE